MNQFTIKKLAEVQAFNALGDIILSKAGQGFGNAEPQVTTALKTTSGRTLDAGLEGDGLSLFDDKTAKTVDKLSKMMELYIGDEWDNPVEVLEWSSFYAGAGAAHSALASSATAQTHPELSATLQACADSYQALLQEVIGSLRAEAGKRSQ